MSTKSQRIENINYFQLPVDDFFLRKLFITLCEYWRVYMYIIGFTIRSIRSIRTKNYEIV